MENRSKKADKSCRAAGGGLLIGLGAGFFVLKASALAFVGCMLIGLGAGIVLSSIISREKV